jgi:hypothetical protein
VVSHVVVYRFFSGEARGRPPYAWATTCLAPTAFREAFKDRKKMNRPIYATARLCRGLLAFSVVAPSVVPGFPTVSWRAGGQVWGRPPEGADDVSFVGEHRFLCGEACGRPPEPWAATCLAPTTAREAFQDGKQMNWPIFATANGKFIGPCFAGWDAGDALRSGSQGPALQRIERRSDVQLASGALSDVWLRVLCPCSGLAEQHRSAYPMFALYLRDVVFGCVISNHRLVGGVRFYESAILRSDGDAGTSSAVTSFGTTVVQRCAVDAGHGVLGGAFWSGAFVDDAAASVLSYVWLSVLCPYSGVAEQHRSAYQVLALDLRDFVNGCVISHHRLVGGVRFYESFINVQKPWPFVVPKMPKSVVAQCRGPVQ